MKKLFYILVLLSSQAFAQKEGNNWYFGSNCALDFNSGSPVVVTGSAMNQYEGVSSISDVNGQLLFYTDGQTVWNKINNTMVNGTGLGGNGSASQSACIVKQPGANSNYYIFTTDAQLGFNGLQYNVVDMSLNGGFGGVTIKNQSLLTQVTEKVNACVHANGQDIWVLTHEWGNNNYRAYLVTSAGINLTPVVSASGNITTGANNNTIGYLKFSPTGDKVAMALSADNQFWLSDFDNSTGVVSNSILLTSTPGSGSGRSYGVEFSPNGLVLYGSVEIPKTLYQWDLSSGNAATINASRISLNPVNSATYGGSLQLGPDGRIYYTCASTTWLSYIENPDILGLGCNLVNNGVNMSPNMCNFGLPNFNQSYFSSTFIANDVCFGDTTFFDVGSTSGLLGVLWDFGDPPSGLNNTSSSFNTFHVYTSPGTFYVQCIKFYLSQTDTILDSVLVLQSPTVDLGVDTIFCTNQTYTITADSGYSYQWSTGATLQQIVVSAGGTYTVTVSNGICDATDDIILTQIVCGPTINFSSSDTVFCEKSCVDFTDLSTNSPTSWQWYFYGASPDTSTLQNPPDICYNNYGSFDVMLIACNSLGCDTLFITNFITCNKNPTDTIYQSNDTLYSLPAVTYQWFEISTGLITGATNQYYVVTQPGAYYCLISDSVGCEATSNVITITGLQHMELNAASVSVTPNPGNGQFEIVIDKTLTNLFPLQLELTDLSGRLLYKNIINDDNTAIDLKWLDNSVYLLRIYNNKQQFIQKLLIEH